MPEATKYVIVLIDGAADYPLARIGNRTPLMAANTPMMDELAVKGRCGTLTTVPEGMTPDSAVANLSVLGYDPREAYQGRGVLEAASLGVDLADEDMAMRCNLIGLEGDNIADHSAGHISNDEGRALIGAIQEGLGEEGVEFHPGVSYRHLLILRGAGFSPALDCYPPHDHVGRPVADSMIKATAPEAEETAARLNRLIEASRPLLEKHPVNVARKAAGKRQAATIWPWAPGRKPRMKTLEERFGITGSVVSAVDLIHGLGRYAGMTNLEVEGVTGLFDTNYEGKARAALESLESHDLAFVHIEGADEAGHARDLGLKIHCIESIDRRVLKPLVEGTKARGFKTVFAVLPDHLTPVERGDHVAEPVPVLIADPDRPADSVARYDEESARQGSLGEMVGAEFLEAVLGKR